MSRTSKVALNDFATGYVTGCKKGLSPEATLDLIEEISGTRMELGSMIQRAGQIRSKYAKNGVVFPSLAGTTMSKEARDKKNIDFLSDLIGSLDEDSDDSSEETE